MKVYFMWSAALILSAQRCTIFPGSVSWYSIFASWGGQDIGVLAKNAKHWELPTFTVTESYNLQAAFCRTLDADRQISLETAVSYCQLPAVFSFHNALCDAMYAALVTGWIDPAALPTPPKHKKPQKRKAFFSTLEYPSQPRYKVGILPTREKVMNGRKARFAQCPICQERFCVCRWYPLDEQVFYSTIVCPEHGRFPVRLTVTHRTDGQWHGRSTVPVLTDIQRELFQQAKANEPIPCRRRKTKYPWWRKEIEQNV